MEYIKAIVYGAGAMGKIMTRLMVEKGVNIVAAIGNESNIGSDLGKVAGLDYPLNVELSNNADEILSNYEADIAIVAISTEMKSMYPFLSKCVENGMNVLTTADEVSYPWTTEPQLTAKLDKLAKRNNVTVTGGGFQDAFMINLGSVLSGASHVIESITAKIKFNVDDYGPVLAEYYHIGKNVEDTVSYLKANKPEPSPWRNHLESLICDIGLTLKGVSEIVEPITENTDVQCSTLGKTINSGDIVGMKQVVTLETVQGIDFRGVLVAKVYLPDESDMIEWSINGEPNFHMICDNVPTRIATCTQMINRIPDVINAEPGFITLDKLPKLAYRAFPLHFYINRTYSSK